MQPRVHRLDTNGKKQKRIPKEHIKKKKKTGCARGTLRRADFRRQTRSPPHLVSTASKKKVGEKPRRTQENKGGPGQDRFLWAESGVKCRNEDVKDTK